MKDYRKEINTGCQSILTIMSESVLDKDDLRNINSFENDNDRILYLFNKLGDACTSGNIDDMLAYFISIIAHPVNLATKDQLMYMSSVADFFTHISMILNHLYFSKILNPITCFEKYETVIELQEFLYNKYQVPNIYKMQKYSNTEEMDFVLHYGLDNALNNGNIFDIVQYLLSLIQFKIEFDKIEGSEDPSITKAMKYIINIKYILNVLQGAGFLTCYDWEE